MTPNCISLWDYRALDSQLRHDGPGAYHAFDVTELNPGIRFLGHWLEYNKPAARDAEQKLRDFLAVHLAGAPAGKPGTK